MQLFVNRLKNQHVNDLRLQDDTIRPLNVELKEKREQANRHADEMRHLNEQLNEQLERVRTTSKAGLLDRVADLQATINEQKTKISELGARRKANQRKLAEAALYRHRLNLEKEKLEAVRETVGDYFTRDIISDAHRVPMLEKQERSSTHTPAPTLPMRACSSYAHRHSQVAVLEAK